MGPVRIAGSARLDRGYNAASYGFLENVQDVTLLLADSLATGTSDTLSVAAETATRTVFQSGTEQWWGGGIDAETFRLHVRESRGLRETPIARLDVKTFLSLASRKDAREALARRLGDEWLATNLAAYRAPRGGKRALRSELIVDVCVCV